MDMNLEEIINITKKELESDQQFVKDKDNVMTKYKEYFKPENIDYLTKERIKEFFNVDNNKHWSGLSRNTDLITKDMDKLKKGLKILLNEKIPLTNRIKQIRDSNSDDCLKGFGNAHYTPILLISNPEKYPVVNNPVVEALHKLGYPTKDWESKQSEWEYVPKIQEIVKKTSASNNIDLWNLDSVWWKILHPKEISNYFILTQNPNSKYNDIEAKQYQYDSNKPNYKQFIEGSKVIVQTKSDKYYFIGYGKIGEIEKESSINAKGSSLTKYTATYSEYEKFDAPKIRTDEILKEMKSLPQYGSYPPSILPISDQLYNKITNKNLNENYVNNNVNSTNLELLKDKNQIIFYGPPGTGKTRESNRMAKYFIRDNRNFDKVRINKIIQDTEIESFSDEEYNEYVLEKIKDEAKLHDYKLIQENNNIHLYPLKKNENEIRLVTHFSSSSKQNPYEVFLSVSNQAIKYLSKVSKSNRYHVIINDTVKNFIVLPYEIKQKYAKFISSKKEHWDNTGIEKHAFRLSITKDSSELSTKEESNDKKYDCEKFVRNIKMIFDNYNYIRSITFHPSYSYEEFVEGIKPKLNTEQISYTMQDGVFKSICNDARDDPDNKYVLVIDEINRGNISKIFGELITLIENDKRENIYSTLTYTKESFTVPKNLYIIGTMNTADKSIALLDIALRRRFGFVELMPDYKIINKDIMIDGEKFNLSEILEKLNKTIERKIGRERQIGHSYFMKNDKAIETEKQLRSIFANEILPLLQEYCYEDNELLSQILGKDFVSNDRSETKWRDNFKDALNNMPKSSNNE